MKFSKTIWVFALYSFLLLSMTSCRPKGILHSREMRDIIIDLHKTDALLFEKGYRFNEGEIKAIYYSQVLEKHHTTQAQFDSSLVWYTAHPALFDKIYPKVLKELKDEETAFLEQYPEFAAPKRMEHEDMATEEHLFRPSDLDSTLWVIREGLPNSWNEWKRPYRVLDW